jgi:hypothetical protein
VKRFEGLGLTAVLAISATVLAGCDRKSDDWQASSTTDKPTRVCVDKDGKRVPDAQCPPPGQQVVHSGGSGIGTAFLWYYIGSQMGRSYAVPPMGRPVTGGGYVPTSGMSYGSAPASAVSRGGFGGIGRGFGGAGGAGE